MYTTNANYVHAIFMYHFNHILFLCSDTFCMMLSKTKRTLKEILTLETGCDAKEIRIKINAMPKIAKAHTGPTLP